MKTKSFSSVSFSKGILKALQELGFTDMTPIQAACIPAFLSGDDIVGQSKTGTGKTASYVLPILQKIKSYEHHPQALILSPTRELCDQILQECRKFSKYLESIRTVGVIGGQSYLKQVETLGKGIHLIVGTPGRTLELIKNKKLDVTKLKFLVLDEADRLLEEGFADEMKAIIKELPKDRQTAFFSATIAKSVEELSRVHQRNAKRITAVEDEQYTSQIYQFLYKSEKPEKVQTLEEILKAHPSNSTLIFCRTKLAVDEIGNILKQRNIPSEVLHSDLKQTERDQVTAKFRSGNLQILVATDVAARGLDIEMLELVINYDLPSSSDIYIHRIGRTARAGRSGTAVSIATAYEAELVSNIEKATGQKMILKT